jgi:hypothetical protein
MKRASFPCFAGSLLEQPDKTGYEPVNVRRETGRREEEPEQDADQRMQDTQAGVPAQDKYRDGQHDQGRYCYRQRITSFPVRAAGNATSVVTESAPRLTARPPDTIGALNAP